MIELKDVVIEHWRKRPPGGQHVGTETGVVVTHPASGLVAKCDTARSQRRNVDIALDMIEGGLTSPHFR